MVLFYSLLVFFLSFYLFRLIRDWSPWAWVLAVLCWTGLTWMAAGELRDFHEGVHPIEPAASSLSQRLESEPLK